MASLDPIDIGRDLNDPVRIMSDEVGADDMAHDQRRFVLRRSRRDEQRAADFLQTSCGDLRHDRASYSRAGQAGSLMCVARIRRTDSGSLMTSVRELFRNSWYSRTISGGAISIISRFSIQNSMT